MARRDTECLRINLSLPSRASMARISDRVSLLLEENDSLREDNACLLEALRKAAHELNEIRARDGVPYTHQMMKASVTEEYFSSVVDGCFAAIAKAEGK